MMRRLQRPSALLLCGLLAAAVLAPTAAHAARKKSAKIDCVVRNEAGEPIAGAAVLVTSPSAPDYQLELTTDAEGKFGVILDQPELDYLWTVTAEGYEPLISVLEIDPRYPRTYDLVVKSLDSPESRKRRAVEVYNRGVDELQSGKPALALASFREAAELDPELREAQRAIAEAALQGGEPASTIQAAEAMLESDPRSIDGLRLLLEASLSLADEDRLERAATTLSEIANGGEPRATQAATYAAVLVFNDGVAAERRGEGELAERRYRVAADLDPKLAAAQAGLAFRRLEAGDAAEALVHADRFLELDPGNAQGLRLRYFAATALGDPALIAEALAALEASAPETAAEESYRRGEAMFKAGDLAGAKPLLTHVLELDPTRADAHYTLGLCFLNGGDQAQARAHLEKVIELAPDTSWASDARQMLDYLK